jgi:hypothetical protein
MAMNRWIPPPNTATLAIIAWKCQRGNNPKQPAPSTTTSTLSHHKPAAILMTKSADLWNAVQCASRKLVRPDTGVNSYDMLSTKASYDNAQVRKQERESIR